MNLTYSRDRDFVQRLTEIVESNLSSAKFGEEELIRQSGAGRIAVIQQVRQICRKTLSQFICDIRLKKAFGILQSGELTPEEVSRMVGFTSYPYFSACFLDYFGFSPGESKMRTTEKK